ncbi:MAG TPA: nucleoside-diphosphate kinase [Bacillota bacterium]
MKLPLEKTLILVKPDGLQRGLVGAILGRFERVGLKIVALRVAHPTRAQAEAHYPNTREWIEGMGQKTLQSYKENGVEPFAEVGTDDPLKIGEMVKNWNIDYLSSGPVVACALEGYHAIQVVRKMCGNTLPLAADPGTIRGDYSVGSPIVANALKHAIHNLIHASSTPDEAAHEIAHWFPDGGLVEYKRIDEAVMF